MLQPDGHLLRIFIGESDKKDGAPLYQWIVRAAKREGLSGATVLRGMEGFGAHSKIHDSKFLDMSADLPIIIADRRYAGKDRCFSSHNRRCDHRRYGYCGTCSCAVL